MFPAFLESYKNGSLERLSEKTFALLESCAICPRKCRVNRLKNEKGVCKTGLLPRVCSYMPHHGEEPPVSGSRGSGTIFFSNCNMSCVYCQNYEFSQEGEGKEVSFEELAEFMLSLQGLGCHNINLVSPTHVMPQILKSLFIAINKGLKIPIVYNTGGYELEETIKLLEGIIDIYMPDMRYGDAQSAVKYSNAPDYPVYNQNAVKEMHNQVGVAKINKEGIIYKGLIIRHLVLPQGISGTDKIMQFISRELSKESFVSLMSQYFPCYKAGELREVNRRISYEEYEQAKKIMHGYGLYNGWTQEAGGLERFAGINIKSIFKK
ncbi:MAG: radical SAM protein [Candidatus Omnitrophota bacterium]|nr:MAG: radical SAM protein [Candidatus Omnitrophota bacterium]